MSVAQQFLKELKEGNTVAAIEAIKEGLRQDAYQKIEEARQEILESYGFVLNEQTFYAIKDTNTGKVISTHDNEADAKDEAEGLGGGVKVVKTKKAPKGWSMKESIIDDSESEDDEEESEDE